MNLSQVDRAQSALGDRDNSNSDCGRSVPHTDCSHRKLTTEPRRHAQQLRTLPALVEDQNSSGSSHNCLSLQLQGIGHLASVGTSTHVHACMHAHAHAHIFT